MSTRQTQRSAWGIVRNVRMGLCALLIGVSVSQAGTRIWNGAGAANNFLASNPTNWADTNAPAAGDAVVLDSRTNKNMTWDLNIELGSWTQVGYAGTVSVMTVYGTNGFTNLAIQGNCIISNGVWDHAANTTAETYRLCVTIGSNLFLGPAARIDVMAKGFAAGYGPGKGVATHGAASHGGVGIYRTDAGVPGYAPCYGNLFAPTNCGSGGVSNGRPGGGAIRMTVAGGAFVEGWIAAESQSIGSGNDRAGSGGSILLTLGSLIGTGVVSVCGGSCDVGGGGGRLAFYVTGESSDFTGWSGSLRAYGGTSRSSGGSPASAGTIYQETAAQTPGQGALIVNNGGRVSDAASGVLTHLSGSEPVSACFSALILTNGGMLAVCSNETLDIRPASGASVICSDSRTALPAGIQLMKGGSLRTADPFVLSNYYLCIGESGAMFSPAQLAITNQGIWVVSAPHVMTSQVTLADGGVLTHAANGTTDRFKIDLTLFGDMTIATNGKIDLVGKGYSASAGPGGGGKASHGGRGGYASKACYGSLTQPVTLGSSAGGSLLGGGAARLRLTGRLTVEGAIDADGVGTGADSGAGGSIWVEAGELAGSGPIRARGGGYNVVAYGGGGGRIALTVTNSGADFSSHTGTVSASGSGPYAGAGTVYLRTAAQGVGAGTLVIENTDPKGDGTGRTEITTNLTDRAVGAVLIRPRTGLYLSEKPWTHSALTWTPPSGVTRAAADAFFVWPVSRVWSNGGAFNGFTNTAVRFDPPGAAAVSIMGTSVFYGVISTNPGSTLGFAANSRTTIQAGGLLRLKGSVPERLRLRSSVDGVRWPLTLLSSVEQDVYAVDVQDSDASVGGGATVLAYDSLGESANNLNWQFLSTTAPPITNYWTGGVDSGWLTPGNWSAGSPPLPADWVVISNDCAFYPALTQNLEVRDLAIRSGARLELLGYSLAVTGRLEVAGLLKASGSETITLQGDTDFRGGTMDAAQSLLSLAAVGDQALEFDGNAFYRIVVKNPGRTVSFGGGFTADRLTCENPSTTLLTLAFEPGKAVQLNQLRLKGHVTEKSVRAQASAAGSVATL